MATDCDSAEGSADLDSRLRRLVGDALGRLMGLKYAIHRSDTNAADLERGATQLGLRVWKIGKPVDWLVTGFGLAVACEVKAAKGKLRRDQIAFLEAAGEAGRVLRTMADVLALYHDLKYAAWKQRREL